MVLHLQNQSYIVGQSLWSLEKHTAQTSIVIYMGCHIIRTYRTLWNSRNYSQLRDWPKCRPKISTDCSSGPDGAFQDKRNLRITDAWKALIATGKLEVIPDHPRDNQLFSLEHVTCRMNEQLGSGPNCLFSLLRLRLLTDTCSAGLEPISCHFSWLLSSWQTGGMGIKLLEEGMIRKAYCSVTSNGKQGLKSTRVVWGLERVHLGQHCFQQSGTASFSPLQLQGTAQLRDVCRNRLLFQHLLLLFYFL